MSAQLILSGTGTVIPYLFVTSSRKIACIYLTYVLDPGKPNMVVFLLKASLLKVKLQPKLDNVDVKMHLD